MRINRDHPLYWTPLDGSYTIVDRPLWFHTAGLQETVSGYGKALTSARCVVLPDGRTRRVRVTQYSNAGTAWIVLDGTIRLVS